MKRDVLFQFLLFPSKLASIFTMIREAEEEEGEEEGKISTSSSPSSFLSKREVVLNAILIYDLSP